jgi:alpha-galactosidase
MDDIKQGFGLYYRLMLEDVRKTLGNLKENFPGYQGQGYEIAGLVWFQGWNDMVNSDYTAEYAKHMANFIRDVRKDLGVPKMPLVIGQLGVGGVKEENGKRDAFKDAQAKPASLPEFRGNVALVKTDQYWDMTADAVFKKGWQKHLEEWNKVGSDRPYHYLGSAICYSRIGKAFGEAMIRLSTP